MSLDLDRGRLEWLRYLDGLDELVSAATDAVAGPAVEQPSAPLPADLGARARAALDALATAERTLEERLDRVRVELRTSSQGRRRALVSTSSHASTFDVLA